MDETSATKREKGTSLHFNEVENGMVVTVTFKDGAVITARATLVTAAVTKPPAGSSGVMKWAPSPANFTLDSNEPRVVWEKDVKSITYQGGKNDPVWPL